MIKSMTGYGRAEGAQEGQTWIVEVKSLNHRYTEVIVRLPSAIASLETEIKKRIGERVNRGRIDVTVQMDTAAGPEGDVHYELDLALLRNYFELLRRVKKELKLKDPVDLNTISRFKELFVPAERKLDVAKAWTLLQKILDEAVGELLRMRRREGEMLQKDFLCRIEKIRAGLQLAKSRVPGVLAEYQKKLADRVRELTGGIELDAMRLAQEVALLAEKTDITEEIVRLESHLDQLGKLLESREAVGRKIDFLLQEMCREVNTMGSKSSDVALSHQVIELKSEITKLREQVQNVE